MKEVVKVAEEVTGKPIKLNHGPQREGDPTSLVADSTRARKELHWVPERTDLRVIIEDAWNWERKRRSRS